MAISDDKAKILAKISSNAFRELNKIKEMGNKSNPLLDQIGKSLNEKAERKRLQEQTDKEIRRDYIKAIKFRLDLLSSNKEKLDLLKDEKERYGDFIIEANEENDDHMVKFLESIQNEIILKRIEVLESKVLRETKKNSVNANSSELKSITLQKSESISLSSNKNAASGKSLKWLAGNSRLTFISADLKDKGYTETRNSFRNAFKDQKECNWLKNPEALAYLLHLLYNESPKAFATNTGKGYFKIAGALFHDYSQKIMKKINFSDLVHRVTKRDVKKHISITKSIGFLVRTSESETATSNLTGK